MIRFVVVVVFTPEFDYVNLLIVVYIQSHREKWGNLIRNDSSSSSSK